MNGTTLVVMGLMNICECIFGTSGRFALNKRKNISTKSTSWAIIWPTWIARWRKDRGRNCGLLAEISWSLWYFDSAAVIALIHHRFCCNSDMVSKICCCNGAATTHRFSGLSRFCYMLVFNAGNSIVWIPSFILFEKTNRGRMVWFYVL